MKIINISLVIVSILVLIGLFYRGSKDDDVEVNTTASSNIVVLSLNQNILKIDGDNIYIIEGTLQEEILNNITSGDSSRQSYLLTVSDGSSKTLDKIYEYDRLYVRAENGVNQEYYTFLYIESLD